MLLAACDLFEGGLVLLEPSYTSFVVVAIVVVATIGNQQRSFAYPPLDRDFNRRIQKVEKP